MLEEVDSVPVSQGVDPSLDVSLASKMKTDLELVVAAKCLAERILCVSNLLALTMEAA